MPLTRQLEPECMDTLADALDYNEMDHSEVNRRFVADLLAVAPELCQPPAASDDAGPVLPPPAMGLGPFALPGSPAPLEVLDLGTGTALVPIELCKQTEHCRVLAIDAAASMLEIGHYNLELARLSDRIMLDLRDAKELPFRDGRFPVVMSNSIIHHIPLPLTALQEAVRVAADGGLLFFRDLLRPESDAQVDQFVDLYAAGANDHQRQLFRDSLHAALDLAEIRSLVAQAGFPPETVAQTSDRHWTWIARKPNAAA